MNRPFFPVFYRNREILHELGDNQLGCLFRVLFDYAEHGTLPALSDPSVRLVFLMFKKDIDESLAHYTARCQSDSRARQNRTEQNKTEQKTRQENRREEKDKREEKTREQNRREEKRKEERRTDERQNRSQEIRQTAEELRQEMSLRDDPFDCLTGQVMPPEQSPPETDGLEECSVWSETDCLTGQVISPEQGPLETAGRPTADALPASRAERTETGQPGDRPLGSALEQRFAQMFDKRPTAQFLHTAADTGFSLDVLCRALQCAKDKQARVPEAYATHILRTWKQNGVPPEKKPLVGSGDDGCFGLCQTCRHNTGGWSGLMEYNSECERAGAYCWVASPHCATSA